MSAGQIGTQTFMPGGLKAGAILATVFVVGLAAGAGGTLVARGQIGAADRAAEVAQAPAAISRTLDTSRPYLTIQDGVVVVPRSALSAALDTSRPYLTVQDGVVVPPRTGLSSTLDTSRPYLTVQDGVVVVPRTGSAKTVRAIETRRPGQ